MKVLITGADGQLGNALQDLFVLQKGFNITACNHASLDITDSEAVEAVISRWMPDVIINCAAYNDVDKAEECSELAFLVNASGPKNLAIAAQKISAVMVQISSDFVFDGEIQRPYVENDSANPLSVYGASKLQGEREVVRACEKHFVIRTSWLYSAHGDNFVKAIVKAAQENKSIKVVTDQTGSPTYAKDLAYMICNILTSEAYGLYHYSNTSFCSRFEFAMEILRQYQIPTPVLPINSTELNRPALRPSFSALDNALVTNTFKIVPRKWNEALAEFIQEMQRG